MQAIQTKYLPATNFKGSRIKAWCERGSITISYPDELSGDACHIAAADALVAKFVKEDEARYGTNKNPWSEPRVCGGIANGQCVHVFCPAKNALQKLVDAATSHRWKTNSEEFDAIANAREVLNRN